MDLWRRWLPRRPTSRAGVLRARVTVLALLAVTVTLALLLAVRYNLAWPPVVVSILGGVPTLYVAWLAVPGVIGPPEPTATTPAELRSDLITLLQRLDEQARTGLPPYLPASADVTALSRPPRVRPHVRTGAGDEDPGGQTGGGVYRLPVDRSHDNKPPQQIATEYRRLVVLSDPGLGKSWLVRTETHRLCKQALDRLAPGPGPVVIPVPLRCDQVAAAAGPDLASRAAGFLVTQGLLERSRGRVEEMVRSGGAVVLLDALDELTAPQSGPVRRLVSSWANQAGGRARCVITSRIAGYTGSPLPDAQEVELQAFTSEDVAAVIKARLPPAAAARLQKRLKDPATAPLARIPLLLAMLCSLAAEPGGEALPTTRGQLFERILRWFLTGAHRRLNDPGAPVRDNVEVGALLQILAPLAFTFATRPAGWTDLMPQDDLLSAIRAAGPAFTDLGHQAATDVLRELSVNAGVLVPDGDPSAGQNPRYLFLHRCVAEYLTARHLAHLATLPEADWLDTIRQHQRSDSGWAEVIPLLSELLTLDGARALTQHLFAAEDDPSHHTLVTAARVWGARMDAGQLLAPAQADELARRLDQLFQDELTRHTASSAYAAMTYLPPPVLTRLRTRRTDPDENLRHAATKALAGREGPG